MSKVTDHGLIQKIPPGGRICYMIKILVLLAGNIKFSENALYISLNFFC